VTFTRQAESPDVKPKRSRSPRPSRAKAAVSRAKIREGLDQLVAMVNTLLIVVAPYDALQPKEAAVLVNALDEQAEKSPRFRRGVEALLTVTSGGSLGLVVGLIVGRRLARRRVFGPTFSPLIDATAMGVIESMDVKPSEASEAMAAIMSAFDSVGNGQENGAADPSADTVRVPGE